MPRFFRRKKTMDKVADSATENPAENTPSAEEQPVETQVPEEGTPIDQSVNTSADEQQTPAPSQEIGGTGEEKALAGREAFNCPDCLGEGLRGDPAGEHEVCITCKGTGKV